MMRSCRRPVHTSNMAAVPREHDKSTLSKHLLQMKFMQRSALRVQKEAHEAEQQRHIDDEHWVLDLPESTQSQDKLVTDASHASCQQLIYGRLAFKGFNPEIEKIMRGYEIDHELKAAREREMETEVNEEEMVDRYESLIGTIAKKFKGKKRHKEDADSPPSNQTAETDQVDDHVDQVQTQTKKKKVGERKFLKPPTDD